MAAVRGGYNLYKATRNDSRVLSWTAGMALQPDLTTLGQLWDGDGYGVGAKHLSLGKLLDEQQKLLLELSQMIERSIVVSILGFCAAAPHHPVQIHPFNGCSLRGSTYILLREGACACKAVFPTL